MRKLFWIFDSPRRRRPGFRLFELIGSTHYHTTLEKGWQKVREKTLLVWSVGDLEPGEEITRHFQGQVYVPLSSEGYQVTFNTDDEVEVINEASASADRALTAHDSVTTLAPRPILTLTQQTQVNSSGSVVTCGIAANGAETGPVQPLNQAVMNTGAQPTVSAVPVWSDCQLASTSHCRPRFD